MMQYMRIERNATGERLNRAFRAAQRYVHNIKSTKSYKSTRGDSSEKDIDTYFRDLSRARRRQYSRSTYMGLSDS